MRYINSKYRFLFVLIFMLSFLYSKAQLKETSQLRNISFGFVDKKVAITYDLISNSLNEEFYVFFEIFKKSGEKIAAKSLQGDVNVNIKPGNNKKIIWDSRKDLDKPLDDDVYIVLSYTKSIQIPEANHLVKSLIMPGLGRL